MKIIITLFSLTLLLMNTHSQNYPDPLIGSEGTTITNKEDWETKRRDEIYILFANEVYGYAPLAESYATTFEVVDQKSIILDEVKCVRKRVHIYISTDVGTNYFELLLFVPELQSPSPCFLLLSNRDRENTDPARITKTGFWPAEEIVKKGYAAAVILNDEIALDDSDWEERKGIKKLFDDEAANSWGAVAAWAWGASRAMDYFGTDADIDAKKVAIVGHSRGGKAALWAGASDERFAMVVSNNSGCSGAALARRKSGERVKDINDRFPHWFAGNYKKYNNAEDDLPMDQHMLLALIAPRKVYVASASEDAWADPQGEYLAWQMAAPVYQLYDETQEIAPKDFEPGLQHWVGNMGYHLRPGKHNLTPYDWQRYLEFSGW